MEPHVVVLDAGVDWQQNLYPNLQLAFMQSFCNEAAVMDATLHGSSMLSVLSKNLDCRIRISMGKVISSGGKITSQGFARALIWAAELNPEVVVIPLGMNEPNSSVKAALEILANTNAMIFAAVGQSDPGQNKAQYPAAYPECVSVGCEQYSHVYAAWPDKPDVLIQEPSVYTKVLKQATIGTASATMLAVAEYMNHEYCEPKRLYAN